MAGGMCPVKFQACVDYVQKHAMDVDDVMSQPTTAGEGGSWLHGMCSDTVTDVSDHEEMDGSFGGVMVTQAVNLALRKAKIFDDISQRLAGVPRHMTLPVYESLFGKLLQDTDPSASANQDHPWGDDVWNGMAKVFYRDYAKDNAGDHNKNLAWCRDRRTFIPWFGSFIMLPEFSAKHAKLPSASPGGLGLTVAPTYLYPAIVLLTPRQHAAALKLVQDNARPGQPAVIQGRSNSATQQTTISMAINLTYIDSTTFETVYMICLKILIAISRPWAVNMDHVHLYYPVPDITINGLRL